MDNRDALAKSGNIVAYFAAGVTPGRGNEAVWVD